MGWVGCSACGERVQGIRAAAHPERVQGIRGVPRRRPRTPCASCASGDLRRIYGPRRRGRDPLRRSGPAALVAAHPAAAPQGIYGLGPRPSWRPPLSATVADRRRLLSWGGPLCRRRRLRPWGSPFCRRCRLRPWGGPFCHRCRLRLGGGPFCRRRRLRPWGSRALRAAGGQCRER